MGEGSFVARSAGVSPESFSQSAIANAEPWPRPAQAWYAVFIFSLSLMALQSITPNQMRGQVTALFLLVFNVIGFGLGPSIITFFTDFVFHSNAKIGYSMAATVAMLAPLGVLTIWPSLKPYGRSIAEARAWS